MAEPYDLDCDGDLDWLVYIFDLGYCGSGGCHLAILSNQDGKPERVGKLTITRLPIGKFESKSNGLRDIAVHIGGGGLDHQLVMVPFDGTTYAPNPSMPPAKPSTAPFTTLFPVQDRPQSASELACLATRKDNTASTLLDCPD